MSDRLPPPPPPPSTVQGDFAAMRAFVREMEPVRKEATP